MAAKGHLKNLKTIVSLDANLLLTDVKGRTALHAAARKSHTRIVEYLLGLRKDGLGDMQTMNGMTAQMMAIKKKRGSGIITHHLGRRLWTKR